MERITKRFLKYVSFDTGSDENSETVPSRDKEKILGQFLAEEMEKMGLENSHMDKYGYTYAFLPATKGCENQPSIGLIAHMDTVSEVKCCDIKPKIFTYQGGDIVLENGLVISLKDFPYLADLVGDELIVTDGNTILGADDKAGIAIILEAVQYLIDHPEIKHGRVCIGFTPDEEIGRGPDYFDIKGFGADFAYTVDGGAIGGLDYENFNAGAVKVNIHGVSIHPGSAKDKMVNAVLLANEFISMLPSAETPSHTEGYEGFYHVNDINGSVDLTTLSLIIRDHDKEKFENRKKFIENLIAYLNQKYGNGTFELTMKDSYYNMKEKILPCMYVVERMANAIKKAGITPISSPIRGGTDGATLSYKGLPCPNISTGGFNAHGQREFADINMMKKLVEIVVNALEIQ